MSFITKLINKLTRNDSWYNTYTGQGVTGSDKSISWTPNPLDIITVETLADMYDGGWVTPIIVDEIVETAFRKGIVLTSKEESVVMEEEEPRVQEVLDNLDAITKLIQVIEYGRLYGGALLLLGTDKSKNLEEPLDLNTVSELKHLTVFDRQEIEIETIYADTSLPNYGEPATYRLISNDENFNRIAHESHFLKFEGSLTSRTRKEQNNGWSLSVIQRVYEEIRRFNSTRHNVDNMLADSSQAILKIPDFYGTVASELRQMFNTRIAIINNGRSSHRIMPLDSEEEFKYVERGFAGIPDLLEHGEHTLAAAARMPVTFFIGRSPDGQNATGESDIEIWYGRVGAEREARYIPPLNTLVWLASVTARVRNPESWGAEFPEIETESEKEKADRQKVVAETDDIYINNQTYTPEEVGNHRFAGDEYNDNPLSVEKREETDIPVFEEDIDE
jgi:phage-related protein (TIGR01555 family)